MFARLALAAVLLTLTSASDSSGYTLIPGSLDPGRQPDGNSVVLDAPEGLILVDTGRHAEHQQRLLDAARAAGKPIAAIVNTHWHLDHSGGNRVILTAFPRAQVHASTAIEGALTGFLADSRRQALDYIASGKAGPAQEAEIRRDIAVSEDPEALRPTRPVTETTAASIAGRKLTLHLARHAATEGDVWIEDRRAGLVIAGDLVVAPVPFLDTACPEGWRKALGEIAAVRFTTLIPGHGDPMTRARFESWRAAYGSLLDCAASDAARDTCVTGWITAAAAFIPSGAEKRVAGMVGYYLDTRLRAPKAQARKYCP
jgi:glyoxylase-like metal-dependent hydrolase (beta-lactamase superfamily II)